jgi:predicted transport protein
MVTSPEEGLASMIANMPEKTGKPLEAWLNVVGKSKLQKHGEIVSMLKADHGMTHGFANLVAHKALASDAGSSEADDLVAAQYAGAKAGLKPVYDKLIAIVEGLGKDIELSPKKAYVSLRRSKQFGLIQPSTATRLDLGLALKGAAPKGRLEAAGSWNAMVSHRVKLASAADVDAEVKAWLKQAYEAA